MVAANAVLKTLIESVQTAVTKGDAVQLVSFGTFKQAKCAARTGKSPSMGESLKITVAILSKLVPGTKFKAVVDPKATKRKKPRSKPSVLALKVQKYVAWK
ncbi:HU family DNA-binding protein [Comamonas thiooxydans]|nr:HU family DNA-binding protein [Comamonas thiooxydans]UUE95034.1 HU family DNA-binding protein [Comamonas thiooxydans]